MKKIILLFIMFNNQAAIKYLKTLAKLTGFGASGWLLSKTPEAKLLKEIVKGNVDYEAISFVYDVSKEVTDKYPEKIKYRRANLWLATSRDCNDILKLLHDQNVAIHEAGHIAAAEISPLYATIIQDEQSSGHVLHTTQGTRLLAANCDLDAFVENLNIASLGGIINEILNNSAIFIPKDDSSKMQLRCKLASLIATKMLLPSRCHILRLGASDAKRIKCTFEEYNIDFKNKEVRKKLVQKYAAECVSRLTQDDMAEEITQQLIERKSLNADELQLIWKKYR